MRIIDPNNCIDKSVHKDLPRFNRAGGEAVWTPARAAAWTDGTNGNSFLNYASEDPELRDYWVLGHQTELNTDGSTRHN